MKQEWPIISTNGVYKTYLCTANVLANVSFPIPVNSSTSEGNFSRNHFENVIPVIQCLPGNEEAHYGADKVSISNQADKKAQQNNLEEHFKQN